jgi:methionyl-tRNA formyltransferase
VRIVLLTTVPPVAQFYEPALRDLGHEPVAVVSARHRPTELTPTRLQNLVGMLEHAAPELDVLYPKDKHSLARLFAAYEPDLVMCTGYPWKVPAEALAVPRLGVINQHPALLPRHRGPVPLAWALREGDEVFGLTWHRMDEELDTGAILAQTTIPILDDEATIDEIGPRLGAAAISLLPRVFERVEAGDPGDPQSEEGASWAGHFGEDYAEVDWSRPAREVHNQVRAWTLTFGQSPIQGPIAELDGERVRLLRTSLTERDDALARVECGDGPVWILAHERA